MTKSVTILLSTLLCITFLTSSADASGKRRRRFNKCARVGLSLSETTADLLVGRKRIDVGSVIISTNKGKLVTKVKPIHGCSISDVRVDIFPGTSLAHASPANFPCKKRFRHAKSAIVNCPIKKFSKIVDCCAEHFVVAVYAIVGCKGVQHVGRRESAYAGGPQCTKRHGIPCSYVPVKLVPGCNDKGCDRNTPYMEVCKRNKCVKVFQSPCKGKKCDGDTPLMSTCVLGECKDVAQPPCEDRCEQDIAISSKCIGGVCKDTTEKKCEDRCEDNLPIKSMCDKGACVDDPQPACEPGCSGDTPFESECKNGHCVKNPLSACKDRCDGNTPVESSCKNGACIDVKGDECEDRCEANVPIKSKCEDAACVDDPQPPCEPGCSGNVPFSSECKNGSCKEEPLPACEDRCDGNTPVESSCKNGECMDIKGKECEDRCEGNLPIKSKCEDAACVDDPKSPCEPGCTGNVPFTSECKNGSCKEETLPACEDRCDGETPVESSCKEGQCVEITKDKCEDKCEGDSQVLETCKNAKCEQVTVECGKCEMCKPSTGIDGVMCEKMTCDADERLDEDKCRCCPKCKADEFVTSDGCGCTKKACDACPAGSVCSSYVDDKGNEVTFCRDCDCGYCLKGVDCCRINASGVNCVPNSTELPPSENCQSSDYVGFPSTPKNNVCRGEEKVDEELGMDLVNTCGCVPSQTFACTLNQPGAGEKCFIPRKDGMEI